MNVPFAFLTDYEAGWQGRYHALRSNGMVINLNASAAYRVNELLSLGIGFNAQYLDVTFDNTEVNTGHLLSGHFEGEVDILAAQLVWRIR